MALRKVVTKEDWGKIKKKCKGDPVMHDHHDHHHHDHDHEHEHHHHHDHPHDHECSGSCQGCASQCEHTPLEELMALMKYMVGHNAAHAKELADLASKLQETGNPVLLSKVLTTLIGPEQRKKLYDHLRTEDGRVPVAAASNAFAELVKAFKAGKNS